MNCCPRLGDLRVVGLGLRRLGWSRGRVCSLTPATVRRAAAASDGDARIGCGAMPGARRDSVAFTVVVTVLVCLGALADAARPRALRRPRHRCCSRPSWPRCRWARWWRCYLWLDRYEPEPKRLLALGPAVGRLRRHRGRAADPGHRRLRGRLHRPAEPRRSSRRSPRRPARACSCSCCCGGAAPSSTAILDGIVYAGMVGIGFAFTENILYLAAAYNGTDGMGPGGIEALTGDVRGALPVQPVRAPALHDVHRHRRRHRRRRAQPRRPGPRAAGGLRAAPWSPTPSGTPRRVYGFDGFVRRLPRADGAGVRRRCVVPRGLGAPLRAADADRRAHRRGRGAG